MEKVKLQTDFIRVVFDDELKLYTSIYLPTTNYMTDIEFETQMVELKDLIEHLKPCYIIDDNTNRKYGYSPEMQNWILNLFVNSWNEIGLKKYAQILPTEILGKLTAMQIEELALQEFEMKYKHKMCEDYCSALAWIKE